MLMLSALLSAGLCSASAETAHKDPDKFLIELSPKAIEFTLPFVQQDSIKIAFRSSKNGGQWALISQGAVLNSRLKFEYEPSPSHRTDSFLARTRFTLDTALNLYLKLFSEKKLPKTEGAGKVSRPTLHLYASKFEYENGLFIVQRIKSASDSSPSWMVTNNPNPERYEPALTRRLIWITPGKSFDEYVSATRFETLKKAASVAKRYFKKAGSDGTFAKICRTHLLRLHLEHQ